MVQVEVGTMFSVIQINISTRGDKEPLCLHGENSKCNMRQSPDFQLASKLTMEHGFGSYYFMY